MKTFNKFCLTILVICGLFIVGDETNGIKYLSGLTIGTFILVWFLIVNILYKYQKKDK